MKKLKSDIDSSTKDKDKIQIDFAWCAICNQSLSGSLRPIDGFRADHQARHSNKEKVDAKLSQVQPWPYTYVH